MTDPLEKLIDTVAPAGVRFAQEVAEAYEEFTGQIKTSSARREYRERLQVAVERYVHLVRAEVVILKDAE